MKCLACLCFITHQAKPDNHQSFTLPITMLEINTHVSFLTAAEDATEPTFFLLEFRRRRLHHHLMVMAFSCLPSYSQSY